MVALLARSPESVLVISNFVLFPLGFASNVFVDPRTMPAWLRTFVDLNPVSHLVDASRGLMQGSAAASDVLWVAVASAALVVIFGPITMALYRRR
jgi:ABC-2 type transport system permease protein